VCLGISTATGLEPGIFDDAEIIHLLCRRITSPLARGANHAGPDITGFGIQLAHVGGIFAMIQNFFTVCHGSTSQY
jgi:hypothetical protein